MLTDSTMIDALDDFVCFRIIEPLARLTERLKVGDVTFAVGMLFVAVVFDFMRTGLVLLVFIGGLLAGLLYAGPRVDEVERTRTRRLQFCLLFVVAVLDLLSFAIDVSFHTGLIFALKLLDAVLMSTAVCLAYRPRTPPRRRRNSVLSRAVAKLVEAMKPVPALPLPEGV